MTTAYTIIPQEASIKLRLGDIAVGNIHEITLVRKVGAQMVCHDDGAVMASRAAEGDIETGRSLFLVKGDEKGHQIE